MLNHLSVPGPSSSVILSVTALCAAAVQTAGVSENKTGLWQKVNFWRDVTRRPTVVADQLIDRSD